MGQRVVAFILALLVAGGASVALDTRIGGLSAPEVVAIFVVTLIVVTIAAQRIQRTRAEGPRE